MVHGLHVMATHSTGELFFGKKLFRYEFVLN